MSKRKTDKEDMGNKNSRSRLTRSFEQFDPVAPSSTILNDEGSAADPDNRPPSASNRPSSSSRQSKVAPSPESLESERLAEMVNEAGSEVDCGSPRSMQSPSPRALVDGPDVPAVSALQALPFDFDLTEGQTRRTLMAECEFECSMITPHLFLGGVEVAKSWDVLNSHSITQVINCSASVVDSYFKDREGMSYLALCMVDGRQDDISWFFCEVAQTIAKSVRENKRVLLHCEKGVSRSCSYAIGYLMLSQRLTWKQAFDHVKSRRVVCNPNTAFTCNLMEIGELTSGKGTDIDMLLRLSSHLPHDLETPVFKPCRDAASRRLLAPSSRHLDPSTCFVLRPGYALERDLENRPNDGSGEEQPVDHSIYLWHGEQVTRSTLTAARHLAQHMVGIFAASDAQVVLVKEGHEPSSFWRCCKNEGPYAGMWEDSFVPPIDQEKTTPKQRVSAHETLPPQKPPRRDSASTALSQAEATSVTNTATAQAIASALGAALSSVGSAATSSTERMITVPSGSNTRLNRSDSVSSNGSGRGVTQRQSASNLQLLNSPHLSPDTSTASIGRDGAGGGGQDSTPLLNRRTPSADKYPKEPGLIREPTPVEDLVALGATSRTLTGTPASTGATFAAQPSSGITAALLKPRLFQAVQLRDEDDDGEREAECLISVYGWQGMGVYDDDDLIDTGVLLLLCPPPGPHFLWIGMDFDVSSVVELELEDVDAEEEQLPLRQWATRVIAGEAEVLLRGGLKPEELVVEISGQESEEFWASFSEGQ